MCVSFHCAELTLWPTPPSCLPLFPLRNVTFLGFLSEAQRCYCLRPVIEWFFKAFVLVYHDLCSALLHGYLMVFFVIACQLTWCTSLTICALTLGCQIISVRFICRVFGRLSFWSTNLCDENHHSCYICRLLAPVLSANTSAYPDWLSFQMHAPSNFAFQDRICSNGWTSLSHSKGPAKCGQEMQSYFSWIW